MIPNINVPYHPLYHPFSPMRPCRARLPPPHLEPRSPSRFAGEDPPLSPNQHSSPHTAQPKEAPTPDPESHLEAEDTILSLNQHPSLHAGQPQEVPTHHGESKNDDHGTKVKKTLLKLPPGGIMAARANAMVGPHFEQHGDGQGY